MQSQFSLCLANNNYTHNTVGVNAFTVSISRKYKKVQGPQLRLIFFSTTTLTTNHQRTLSAFSALSSHHPPQTPNFFRFYHYHQPKCATFRTPLPAASTAAVPCPVRSRVEFSARMSARADAARVKPRRPATRTSSVTTASRSRRLTITTCTPPPRARRSR